MKLQTRFIQLPVQFDAELLARELSSPAQSDWMPHPAGYEGNDFLPLISAYGDPHNEAFEGPMRPTPFLSSERPYLVESGCPRRGAWAYALDAALRPCRSERARGRKLLLARPDASAHSNRHPTHGKLPLRRCDRPHGGGRVLGVRHLEPSPGHQRCHARAHPSCSGYSGRRGHVASLGHRPLSAIAEPACGRFAKLGRLARHQRFNSRPSTFPR